MRIIPAMLAVCCGLGAQQKPVTGCPDLRSLTNHEVTIAVAAPVAETPNAPAHCRVFGQVLPQVGFEVRLPAEWNGRFGSVARERVEPGAFPSGQDQRQHVFHNVFSPSRAMWVLLFCGEGRRGYREKTKPVTVTSTGAAL